MSKTTNEDYSSLQQYFEEVRFVYDKNGNDTNIEYSPENREKLIEMCGGTVTRGLYQRGV